MPARVPAPGMSSQRYITGMTCNCDISKPLSSTSSSGLVCCPHTGQAADHWHYLHHGLSPNPVSSALHLPCPWRATAGRRQRPLATTDRRSCAARADPSAAARGVSASATPEVTFVIVSCVCNVSNREGVGITLANHPGESAAQSTTSTSVKQALGLMLLSSQFKSDNGQILHAASHEDAKVRSTNHLGSLDTV